MRKKVDNMEAKVPKSGLMRLRYKGDSGGMRMTLSGYGRTQWHNYSSAIWVKAPVKNIICPLFSFVF